MKVYLVTEGDYDDYGVRGAFELKSIADAAVAAGFGDNIEEFEMLESVPEKVTVYVREARWCIGQGKTAVEYAYSIELLFDCDWANRTKYQEYVPKRSDGWYRVFARSTDRAECERTVEEFVTKHYYKSPAYGGPAS